MPQADAHPLLLGCLLLAGHRLTLALAGTAVGTGALAADRQALTVTKTTIAGDIQQTLDAHLHLGTKLTLDLELIVDDVPDGGQLIVVPFMHFLAEIDPGLVQDITGGRVTYPIDVCQSNLTPFILREVNAGNTSHSILLSFFTFNNE